MSDSFISDHKDSFVSDSFLPDSINSGANSSPDAPLRKDIFGSDLDRFKSSFGNFEGVKKLLSKKGYTDIHQNKEGEIIVKDPSNGEYYKDSTGNKHILNWMEAHAGGSLPLAGMGLGAAAFSPFAPIAGTIAGGGVGAAAGESARQGLGSYFGTNTLSEYIPDVLNEGAGGAAAEGYGKAIPAVVKSTAKTIGKIPVPLTEGNLSDLSSKAYDKTAEALKNIAAYTSNMLTGSGRLPDKVLPDGTIQKGELVAKRLLDNPDAVNAAAPSTAQSVADESRAALANLKSQSGERASAAKNRFLNNYGQTPVNTSGINKEIYNIISNNGLNEQEEGKLLPEELEAIRRKATESLSTQIPIESPVMASSVRFEPSKTIIDTYSPETNFKKMVSVPGEEYVARPGKVENVPVKGAESLYHTAEYLERIAKSYYDKDPSSKIKSKGVAAHAARIAGMIRSALYSLDPNDFAQAAKESKEFLNNLEKVSSLTDETKGASFIKNLFNDTKGETRDAVEQLIPDQYGKMKDIQAKKQLGNDRLSSYFGKNILTSLARPALNAAASYQSYQSHDPTLAIGTALATGATSPAVNRAILTIATKFGPAMAKAALSDQNLIPFLLKGTGWSDLPVQNQEELK